MEGKNRQGLFCILAGLMVLTWGNTSVHMQSSTLSVGVTLQDGVLAQKRSSGTKSGTQPKLETKMVWKCQELQACFLYFLNCLHTVTSGWTDRSAQSLPPPQYKKVICVQGCKRAADSWVPPSVAVLQRHLLLLQ